MPPSLTNVHAAGRGPAAEDHDPSRLVIPPSVVTNMSAAPLHISIDKLRLPSKPEHNKEETGSSTIRLAHAATGRMKEVIIVSGTVPADRRIQDKAEVYPVTEITDLIQSQILDLPDIALEVSEELQINDPRLCEAVLRSVFAPRAPGESLDDCMQSAEVVRLAFTLQPSVYSKAESRALKVAQYRRAEVQLKLEALKKDEDVMVPISQFDDPVVYQSWKVDELQILSNLVDLFGNLPSFSGGVQVEILSGEELKPMSAPKCAPPVFKKKPVEIQVYCSVTILPARPGTIPSPVESEDGLIERTPAYFSEVVTCSGEAEWNTRSPWIPVSSLQDRILIEVWEKTEDVVKAEDPEPQPEVVTESQRRFGNFSELLKRSNSTRKKKKKKKVAPWSGDTFLGQVIVSFSHIESQALAQGGVQGQSPATSYMLADERGKQGESTIQLQFTCSCERFYRDAPPNKLLLMPPIEEIESAFDNFVRLAFHAENEALFQLGPQWRQLVYGFGAHYRIREERCALGMVNIMTGLFQEDARYCIGIVPEWLPACSAARDGRLTRNELALHCNIVVLLMKPAVNALENFQTLFPGNKPRGAIPRLIELLGLILRWEPDPAEILLPLRSCIQKSCERRLHKQLFRETDDSDTREISAQLLLKAVRLVRSDLVEHSTTYKGAFPDGFDLPQVTAPIYYRLVCHYVRTLIGAGSLNTFTKECGELVNELLSLQKDMEKLGVQIEPLDIKGLFSDNVEQWIRSLGPRMIDWVSSSVSTEKWEPLSTQTDALFSFSVVDLYVMIGQVTDEVTMRLFSLPFGEQYMDQVEDAICRCVHTYVAALEQLCLHELPEEPAKTRGNGLSDASTFCVSKALCVQLNNINAVLGEQQKFESALPSKWHSCTSISEENKKGEVHLEEDLGIEVASNGGLTSGNEDAKVDYRMQERFSRLLKAIQQTLAETIGAVVESIQTQFVSQLQCVLQAEEVSDEKCDGSIEQRLQPSMNLLDQHLTVMNEMLHPKLLRQFLRDIPGALLWRMEEIALGHDEGGGSMTSTERHNMEKVVNVLNDYFGGLEEVASSTTMQGCARLCKVLACWDMEPRELCALYWQAWGSLNNSAGVESQKVMVASAPNGHRNGVGHHVANGNYTRNKNGALGAVSEDPAAKGIMVDVQLHVLDYFSLLRQKDDDKARQLVMQQSSPTHNRFMQVAFRLPKGENLLSSHSCRVLSNVPGMFYITPKRICFAEAPGRDRGLSFSCTFEQILRVQVTHNNMLVFVIVNSHPMKFSRIADTDAVCRVIYEQVAGTETALENYMAPLCSQGKRINPSGAIKKYQCSKQELLKKLPGTLVFSSGYFFFEENHVDQLKGCMPRFHMDHGSVAGVHAERQGLRPSGVVIKLKTGEDMEFVDFVDLAQSMAHVARDIQRLVLGATPNPDGITQQLD